MRLKVQARADSLQIAALERMNDQANLSVDMYGVIVGGLSALFAIGAVVAAVLLYVQGRDFKQQRQEVLDAIRHEAKGVIAAAEFGADEMMKTAKGQLDVLHADYSQRLEAALKSAPTPGKREQLERQLSEIRAMLANVEERRAALTIPEAYRYADVLRPSQSFWTQDYVDALKREKPADDQLGGLSYETRRQKCVDCGKVFRLYHETPVGSDVKCPYCKIRQAAR
ncbi:MAG TPA: hypothetical protein VJR92_13775 [Gemmatimonadaceae bacterium]|nr:hypothetical protein [Gemmatimonadaceae bacterium]